MSLNPLTREEYEAEKQQSRLSAAISKARGDIRTDADMEASIDFLNTKSEQISEMAQLCRSVETGTARQILEHIEFINTTKLAAAGFGKEASAISAARVTCDRLIRNERIDEPDWQPIASAPKDACWLQVKMDDGQEHRAHYAQGSDGGQPAFKGWFIEQEVGSGKGGYFVEIETPTHWKPEANEKVSDETERKRTP